MKFVFIILLLPSVAFGFFKGVAYKKSEICDKIKSDHKPVFVKLYQQRKKDVKTEDLTIVPDLLDEVASLYRKAEMYKCFKQTPACKESVGDAKNRMDFLYGYYNEALPSLVYVSSIRGKEGARSLLKKMEVSIEEEFKKLDKSWGDMKKYCKNVKTPKNGLNRTFI